MTAIPRRRIALVVGLGLSLGGTPSLARGLSAAETSLIVDMLTRSAGGGALLAEDPSCKSDLAKPGRMSVAEGLGRALLRAALDRAAVKVSALCGTRTGYPLKDGQEYCKLEFLSKNRAERDVYGLAFAVDWTTKSIVPESVECF